MQLRWARLFEYVTLLQNFNSKYLQGANISNKSNSQPFYSVCGIHSSANQDTLVSVHMETTDASVVTAPVIRATVRPLLDGIRRIQPPTGILLRAMGTWNRGLESTNRAPTLSFCRRFIF